MSIFETLSARMAERGHDKRYPGAATVMQRAAMAYAEIRAGRDAVKSNKNLSQTGQHAEILAQLEKAAPELQKHRATIDRARADIDKRRAGMRPKFDKVDPAILIAVAAKIAAMKPADQAALLLSAGQPVDPTVAQAVLTLPPILSGVSGQFRDQLETKLVEATHGAALGGLDEEKEAWATAESALRTAYGAVQETGEFPSQHAFDGWLHKVAPAEVVVPSPDDRRETDALTVDTILAQTQGLSTDLLHKLKNGVGEQSHARTMQEIASLSKLLES